MRWIPGAIPEFLGQLTDVTTLDLSWNQLTGESLRWSELNWPLTATFR